MAAAGKPEVAAAVAAVDKPEEVVAVAVAAVDKPEVSAVADKPEYLSDADAVQKQ